MVTAARDAESPVERALVAHGWAMVDAVERLSPGAATRAFSAKWGTEEAAAREWFAFPDGSDLDLTRHEAHLSPRNVTRYHRTMGYLRHGETVYEVGVGHGVLATMLMQGGGLRGYRGVDIMPKNVDATRRLLTDTGFGDRVDLREQNLYDLTMADVQEVGATLLVCCEVIEHTPDAELALRTLAQALPEGTDLLWSVPLLGRLEQVWGHTSVFSAERVRRMLAEAGLVAHHVDVVANTWIFVLASRSTAPSPRADSAMSTVLTPTVDTLGPRPIGSFVNRKVSALASGAAIWNKRVTGRRTEQGAGGRVRVVADPVAGQDGSSYAGVAFTCPPDVAGVRIQVRCDAQRMSRFYVDFRRAGERVGRWTWDLDRASPQGDSPTVVLREGHTSRPFTQSGGGAVGADTVEFFGQARDGGGVDFTLHRFAWAH